MIVRRAISSHGQLGLLLIQQYLEEHILVIRTTATEFKVVPEFCRRLLRESQGSVAKSIRYLLVIT